jgi:membrane-bound ClpP family serine protease
MDVQTLSENQAGADLVGRKEKVVRALRPFGGVEIDGQRVDAVSQQDYIPLGSEVTIVDRRGKSLVARCSDECEAQ